MNDAVIDVAKTVRKLRDDGLSYAAICARLHELGARPPKGGQWHPTQIMRILESGSLPRQPAPTPPPTPEPPQLPAVVPRVQHEPGTLAWYDEEIAAMTSAREKGMSTAGRFDAQGLAAISRRLVELAEKRRELVERQAAASTRGQTAEQRLQRLAAAAAKMPPAVLDVFVAEWCRRWKVDMDALREARLVRAGEER